MVNQLTSPFYNIRHKHMHLLAIKSRNPLDQLLLPIAGLYIAV